MAMIDMKEEKYGKLTVVEYAGTDAHGHARWLCECDCEERNRIIVTRTQLIRKYVQSCGCMANKGKRFNDLTEERFGKLTVVEQVEDYRSNGDGRVDRQWLCECDCGEKRIVRATQLTGGFVKCCKECAKKERKKRSKKTSEYEIDGEIIKIHLSNSDEIALCDTADENAIKDYLWRLDAHGYPTAQSKENDKPIRLHKVLMDADGADVIDHINRNKLDNRRCNLRKTTYEVNSCNRTIPNTNKYGCFGIQKRGDLYRAYIVKNRKYIHLGYFHDLESAIKARKEAEKIYHPECIGE